MFEIPHFSNKTHESLAISSGARNLVIFVIQ